MKIKNVSNWSERYLDDVLDIIKDGYSPNQNEKLNYIGLEHIAEAQLRFLFCWKFK